MTTFMAGTPLSVARSERPSLAQHGRSATSSRKAATDDVLITVGSLRGGRLSHRPKIQTWHQSHAPFIESPTGETPYEALWESERRTTGDVADDATRAGEGCCVLTGESTRSSDATQ